jgi:Flp pilus assembly protein TadD
MTDGSALADKPEVKYARALVWVAAAAALVGMLWAARRGAPTPADRRLARLVAESLFRNIRPGVGYVGDAACARCHADVAESYRAHPMGRSVATVAAATDAGPRGVPAGAEFDAGGYHYTVERRGGRLIHREQRFDAGEPVASVEAAVAYALGSGERGYSFLVERDGFVAQSPVAWYAQERRYDVAPGYRERNFHFERVILAACLSCHVDGSKPAGGAYNRYAAPLDLRPIGCERCHGPGALHVLRPSPGPEGLDPTIVNPRHLAPALRESVCEQCHLQGADRVLRAGHEEGDFRPGLPLDEFVAVFVEPKVSSGSRAVGQVEQMHASRCYSGSGGALGCTSCHDPHHRPAQAERVEHYRASCLTCHEAKACRLPEPDRRARQADDSCVDCHMPRRGTKDIAHTAMTDHRIPRSETDGTPEATADLPARGAGADPVVRFQSCRLDGPSGAEAKRDLGIALFHVARERWLQGGATDLAWRASVLIDSALAERPDDVPALEARAHLLWMRGRTAEARDAFGVGLALQPNDERLLEGAAALAGATGRRDKAVALLRRAAAVNPYCADYLRRLAVLHVEMSRWSEAAGAARAALGLDPSLVEARIALVVSQARRGDLAAARDELGRLRAFDPDAADALRRALFDGKGEAVSLAPVGETDVPSGEESRPGKTVHWPSSYQSLARGP